MGDAADVMARIRRKPGVTYSVLVPNGKGMEGAIAAKADEIVVFAAASEAFSQKNINCSIDESIERFRPVTAQAQQHGIRIRGRFRAHSVPVSGRGRRRCRRARRAANERHRRPARRGADTIAPAPPEKPSTSSTPCLPSTILMTSAGTFMTPMAWPPPTCTPASNSASASFDSALPGWRLSVCKGATGNVATEDVLYLLNRLGIDTGIDFAKAVATGQWISGILNRKAHSRAGNAVTAKLPPEHVSRSEGGIQLDFDYMVPDSKTVPCLYPEWSEFGEMPQVFATGYLIGLLEGVCQLAIKPFLDWPREQSVGTHVNFSHLAATPPA